MRFIFKILNFCVIAVTLYSCSGLSDAGKVLRNEKTRTTDEFLVKKRDPLILPPDYNTLPKPDSINSLNKKKDNKIQEIFKIQKDESSKKIKSSSVEESIIEKISK